MPNEGLINEITDPLTTLGAAVSAADVLLPLASAPPAALTAGLQYHVRIDNEILTVQTGADLAHLAVIARGAEGTVAVGHSAAAPVHFYLTAEGLAEYVAQHAGGVPAGTAGGDLAGTYPNPTVARVNGVAMTGVPTAGQVQTALDATHSIWATPSSSDPTTTPGDLIVRGSEAIGATNLILGSVGLADATLNGYYVSRLTAGTGEWAAPDTTIGHWVSFDLRSAVANIGYIRIASYQGFNTGTWKLQCATTGQGPNDDWVDVATLVMPNPADSNFHFSTPGPRRYWRVTNMTTSVNQYTDIGILEMRTVVSAGLIRLPIGTEGQTLKVVGGVPTWVT